MSNSNLAAYLADAICAVPFYANDDKVQRIALKGGTYPNRETDLGGLSKAALVNVIQNALDARSAQGKDGKP